MKTAYTALAIFTGLFGSPVAAQWAPVGELQWAKTSEPAPEPSPPEELPPPTSPPIFGGTTNPPAPLPPPQPAGGWQQGQSQWGNSGTWNQGAPAPISAPTQPPANGTWQPTQGQWGNGTGQGQWSGTPTPIPPPSNNGQSWQPGQSQWSNQNTEQPRQPVQGGARSATLPTGAARLSAPRPIAPTNPGELAPTIPLEWSPVYGATYYELAVRDLTTNSFVVDRPVQSTSFTANPYQSGRNFRWTVRACNQSGCGGWSEAWGFRTARASQPLVSRSLTYSDVMSPRERGIFDEHFGYLARIPESNPPAKFTPEHIKRMQDGGRWQAYIIGIEKDNLALRQLEQNPPHFCGAQGGTPFPDRILRTDIYSACRTHDACYASSSTQLDVILGSDAI